MPTQQYHCVYCATTWTEERERALRQNPFETLWCATCGVLEPRAEQQVRYGAWDRPGCLDPVARRTLMHNQVYTIAQVHRWQHATTLRLADVQGEFNVLLFTPVDYHRSGDGVSVSNCNQRKGADE